MYNTAEQESAHLVAEGCRRVTLAEIERDLRALGYTLDRTMDCAGPCRIMTGPRAGHMHSHVSIQPKERDSGLSAFNVNARRDAKFRALQAYRGTVHAVVGRQVYGL